MRSVWIGFYVLHWEGGTLKRVETLSGLEVTYVDGLAGCLVLVYAFDVLGKDVVGRTSLESRMSGVNTWMIFREGVGWLHVSYIL